MSLKILPVELFRFSKIVITIIATITIISSKSNVSMLPHSFVNISNGKLLVPDYRFPPFRDCSGLVFLTIILETNIWILFISTITISIITEVSRFDRQFDITAITSIYIISDSMTMMITITFDIKTMVLTGITIFLTTVVTNIMRIKSLKITFLIWDFFLSS